MSVSSRSSRFGSDLSHRSHNIQAPLDVRVPKSQTFDVSNTVTVLVGNPDVGECSFTLSTDLLTSRSDFFCNALRSNTWKESAEDGVFRLPEDEPKLFALYVQLVYTRTLPISSPDSADKIEDTEYTTLMHLYILAHKLQDTVSQNQIVDTVLAKARKPVPPEHLFRYPEAATIKMLYDGTTGPCAMRRLVVDLHAEGISLSRTHDGSWLKENGDKLPKEFLLDLAVGMREGMDRRWEDWMAQCDARLYHEGEGKKELVLDAQTRRGSRQIGEHMDDDSDAVNYVGFW